MRFKTVVITSSVCCIVLRKMTVRDLGNSCNCIITQISVITAYSNTTKIKSLSVHFIIVYLFSILVTVSSFIFIATVF